MQEKKKTKKVATSSRKSKKSTPKKAVSKKTTKKSPSKKAEVKTKKTATPKKAVSKKTTKKSQTKYRDYILTYYQHIKNGTVNVGKWIELVYEYIVKGLEKGEFKFDAKRANSAIDFIESNVHHTEGQFAPKRIELELWQKANLSCMFGIIDEQGNRQFREVLWILARKQGKSKIANGVAQHMIFNDDEYGARVFCVAPKLDQADIVFQDFFASVNLEKNLKDKVKSRKSDIYVAESNSSIKKIAFNAKKSDGFNPSLVICDEIASWQGEQGLKQYEVMKSAVGARRQPMIFSITTSGYVNDGIYDELVKRSTRFLLGESKEKRLLPFMYMIDDVEKWNDINELKKSNPNMNVSVSVDYLLEEIAIAEGSMSKKNEFMTKYCNIKQNSSVAWLDTTTVNKTSCEHLDINDFRGSYGVIGIDLSKTTDLSCATCVIEREGHLFVFAQFFLPRNKIEEATQRDNLPYSAYIKRGILTPSGENFIDYNDVFQWCVDLVSKYEIYPQKVGYDKYCATYLVQDLSAFGFQCDDVFQGENLTPVIREVEGLMKDGKIKIGDNDLLKIHFLNSAVKVNAETERMKLIKIEQRAHIDGCASFLDAMTVRQKWYAEIGEALKNERGIEWDYSRKYLPSNKKKKRTKRANISKR